MQLTFKSTTTLQEIQESFEHKFPYLRLEFYKTPHQPGKASKPEFIINDLHANLAELTGFDSETFFQVTPATTVADLEQWMQTKLSLPTQIFRKRAGVWIETTRTDHAFIENLNAKARMEEIEYFNREIPEEAPGQEQE